ncbi:MAG: hypothetical protein ABSC03_02035 [Verrucomicrobiota bacterium]
MGKWLAGLGGALLLLTGLAQAAEAIPNADCLVCHEDKTLTQTNANGTVKLLFVEVARLARSVHPSNACVNCHVDVTSKHPDDNVALKQPVCTGCHDAQPKHEAAARAYAESIHGVSREHWGSPAARCTDCHGSHEILAVTNPASSVYKLNLPLTCAKCHSNTNLNREFQIRRPDAAAQYNDSIHGYALMKLGLIVAASCNDCHGVHNIRRSVDHDSPVNPANVARTCGQCHVKVEQIYNRSVHGQLLAKGDKRAPVCTDCHTSHQIENVENGQMKVLADKRCGQCHQDRLEHYRDTYHGKAMALGRPNQATDVAACYDCHGHHDILPPSDPASRLSPQNIVQTCQHCHPKANVGFTQYKPHANPLDRQNYPALHAVFVLMTALLIGVFAFFGAHTLLWLFRSVFLYWTDSKKFREAKIRTRDDEESFSRFQPFDRFLHFLVVTSFLLLVITGMPLKFYYTAWAKVMFNVMGGPQTARTLHHFGAIVTFLYFGLHLFNLAVRCWQHRGALRDPVTGRVRLRRIGQALFGPDSMIPTLQDWRDFIAHNRWFFGKAEKPQFDRWTYWEKFDYFAVFWGVFAIGLSGLIMWFPEFFSRFMPGWIINIALIVHSDEALLAAGFIFTIHFFNTHFRLEKFPMDTVIFSGRVSKTEMLHERKRWFDRLSAGRRLEEHRVKDEWLRWKGIARSFGYIFFGLGVLLLLLIIYAMGTRLMH